MGQAQSPQEFFDRDYSVRVRVLKLRWMGLETEAQELVRAMGYRDDDRRMPWRHRLPFVAHTTD
jgi:hypothetical protein